MNLNDHCTLCPFQRPENCPDCPHRHYRGGDDHNEPPTMPLW